MDIFEEGVYKKVRFLPIDGANGVIALEDLTDLPLTHLDNMYKAVNKQMLETAEESFLTPASKADPVISLKFELIKSVMMTKMDARDSAKKQKATAKEVEELMEILADKQKASKQNLTEAQIKAKIKKLKS